MLFAAPVARFVALGLILLVFVEVRIGQHKAARIVFAYALRTGLCHSMEQGFSFRWILQSGFVRCARCKAARLEALFKTASTACLFVHIGRNLEMFKTASISSRFKKGRVTCQGLASQITYTFAPCIECPCFWCYQLKDDQQGIAVRQIGMGLFHSQLWSRA